MAVLLDEWHYKFEIGNFKTERGNFAFKMQKSDMFTFRRFCLIYDTEGICEGSNFYCYNISNNAFTKDDLLFLLKWQN